MKRYILLLAIALTAVSCVKTKITNEGEYPLIEFGSTFYTVYPGGSADIYVGCSKAPLEDLVFNLSFSGDAVPGKDFECPESVTIYAGTTSCYFSFKDKGLARGVEVGISLDAPKGWRTGINSRTVVAMSTQEQLIYSFSYKEGVLNEALPVTVNLIGELSGKDFIADDDIRVPLACFSRIEDFLEVPEIIVPKGKSSGSTMIRLTDENWQGNEVLVLTVDSEEKRFVPSNDYAEIKLFARGLQTPDKLLGLWRFRSVYDLEELELWFTEMDDDPDLLPVHNDDFKLEFYIDGDKVMLRPSGPGDFNNFFRECEVSLAEPMNLTAQGYKLGRHTTFESNQFIADALEAYQTNTYYSLSVANRAFSSETEELGPATIVFRLTVNGDLCMEFRDYDNASLFGENWWDPDKFDPDMFGFASRFIKVE